MTEAHSEVSCATELVRESDAATLLAGWGAIPVPPGIRRSWEQWNAQGALRRYLDSAFALDRDPTDAMSDAVPEASPTDSGECPRMSGVRVTYRRGAVSDQARVGGRRFAVDGASMQSLPRELRHTLARDVYVDVDMVNAQPTILGQWCARRAHPIPVPILDAYNASRDAHLASIVESNTSVEPAVDRAAAKRVVIAVLNGGWREAEALAIRPAWLADLRREVELLHARVAADPSYDRLRTAVVRRKSTNVDASVLNHVLCGEEDRILSAALSALEAIGASLAHVVLVFDGFMLPRWEWARVHSPAPGSCGRSVTGDALCAMSRAVRASTGYAVAFALKPMDEGLDLSALERVARPPTRIARTHAEAGRLIASRDLAGRVRFCPGGVVYARLAGGDVWTCNRHDALGAIRKIVFDSGVKTVGADGVTPRDFAANGSHAKAIVDWILSDPPLDPAFPARLRDANMRRLFFADGVFDFDLGERGEFRAETAADLPATRIPHAFPRDGDRDAALEQAVRVRVLEAAFGTTGAVDTFLAHVARALACHVEDKEFLVVTGERNSGKGVTAAAIERAFGPYVGTANSNSFLHASAAIGGDEAKKLSWVVACEGKRVVFTQEIKVDHDNPRHRLDGNALKLAVSGGDSIMARRNYTDESPAHFDARLIMMCNEFPRCEPADALEFVTHVRTRFAYVSARRLEDAAARLPMHRLADPSIKDFVRRPDVVAAFTRLVLDAYRREPVQPCADVERDTEAFRGDLAGGAGEADACDGGGGDMRRAFEFTRNRAHSVSSAEATEALRAIGAPAISKQKLRARIEELGAVRSTNVDRNGRKLRGWVGVRLTAEVDALVNGHKLSEALCEAMECASVTTCSSA